MEEVPMVVVSSSDAEEWGKAGGRSAVRRGRSSKRSTWRPRSAPEDGKRRRTRRKGDNLFVASHQQRSEGVDFDFPSEHFFECVGGFNSVLDAKVLWVDKYKPSSLVELAVNKKKVEEVRLWLEERLIAPKDKIQNFTLLLTGQAGVGKSTTIHVIASHLGAKLCEWRTPTPTLWKEHIHNSSSGVNYMSKLDEFEAFVDTIRRYPVLSSSDPEGIRKPVILLIDDLPVTNGRSAYGRLCKCLNALAHSTQVPTVVLITEYLKGESGDNQALNWEELESSLETAGAFKVPFNPLTANSIKKTLAHICRKENCNISEQLLNQISRLSQGDIRHAITSLQYVCLGLVKPQQSESKKIGIHSQGKSSPPLTFTMMDEDNGPSGSVARSFGRDETLGLFHALGKFLHNKRENGDLSNSESDICSLKEKFRRLQLKMDAPENVLYQAHAQARPILDFLYENVLDFLNEDAIDDVWTIYSYLSDADCLLATSISKSWSQIMKGNNDGPETLSHSVAASVSVRGVLFGNSQPLSSRWHSIRRPKLWQIEQLSRHNKNLIASERFQACSFTSSSVPKVATEYKPVIRWLGLAGQECLPSHGLLPQNCGMESDDTDENDLAADHLLRESEEDDIEDW